MRFAAILGPTARAILFLALGQTIVWAGLFYSFAALLLDWESAFGWSKAALTLPFTMAVLLSGAASPVVGRLIDRGWGAWLLSGGAGVGALALGGLAFVESQVYFALAWAVIGVAQAACLYEACFAHVTRALEGRARQAITAITLFAGFASPLSFAGLAVLTDALGWRGALLIAAGLVLGLGGPLLYAGAKGLGSPLCGEERPGAHTSSTRFYRTVLRDTRFWLLALAFAPTAINHGILINHIMPLLDDRGLERAVAVTIASLIGPMQVVGRIAMTILGRGYSAMALTLVSFASLVAAVVLLYAATGSPILAISFACLQGAAYGVTSILKPLVVSQTMGMHGFASVSGMLALPYLACFALAPYLGSLLWERGGYDLALMVAGVAALCGIVSLLVLRRGYPGG